MRLIPTTIVISLLLGFIAYTPIATAGVPNTFSSGTVAKSSEVNENFDFVNYGNIVVKVNGNELGTYVGRHGSTIDVLNANGYIIPVRFDQIFTAAGAWDIVYETTDCTGAAYTYNYPAGTILSNRMDGQLYYVTKNAVPVSLTIGSNVDTASGQCVAISPSSSDTFYPLTLNDPLITGVSSSTFALPITIERR